MEAQRKLLAAPKRCSCGCIHFALPPDYKIQSDGDVFDGYYFNCGCGSTLFARLDAIVVESLETA